MIKFRRPKNISEIFMGGVDSDFEKVKEKFVELNFHSMTKEKAWQKYRKTFERILNEGCTK